MRIAGLAGNRGRNLLTMADREPGGATLAVVCTDDPDAPVLDGAAERGIETVVVERDADEGRRAHETRVVEALDDYGFDLVCLDGWTRVLSETFLDAVPTTLNVHPSLLPAFPGLNVHERVLDAGVAVTGCTVHVVTNGVDEDGAVIDEAVDAGPIVTQEPVPVFGDDDPARLKRRVLHEAEFVAYPRAVRQFVEGRVDVRYEDGAPAAVDVAGDDSGAAPAASGADDPADGDEDGHAPDEVDVAVADRGFRARRVDPAERVARLRYGENPHQAGALYARPTDEPSVVGATQLNEGARALSYNNYNDADAALDLVREFHPDDGPAAAVIKHTNPAGCATADDLADAYEAALSTDPMSAFGGVVALNRPCDAATAAAITDSFKEVVVAPGYTDDALATLRESDSLRVLSVGALDGRPAGRVATPLTGGVLVQDRDVWTPTADDLEVVTDRTPTDAEVETMLFAWRVLRHVRSNGIVLADGTETVGVGMGQVSRVDAVRLAARKAADHAEGKGPAGSVLASDAFFPFPDGVEAAAEAGAAAVVQPGGSVNDDDVIAAANDHDLAMAFTGRRCFRHD
jgi:phosphoribosylaminoimidazolecarboxamide formyltransferase/IMP cyclohydrolase